MKQGTAQQGPSRPVRQPAGTRCLVALVGFGLMGGVLATDAYGQYFGRQKVQYETFDFQVLETPRFRIHFYPEAEQAVLDGGRMAERWYTRLSPLMNHQFVGRKPIIFYADHPDFQQTNVVESLLGEGVGGVTEGLRTRVIMPLAGSYAETDHVLGHELVHAFQFDMAGEGGGSGMQSMGRLPLWLVEGMAEYLTLGRVDPHTAMWLRDAVLRDDIPTVDQLTRDPRYFPYRFGQGLLAYVGGVWGDEAVVGLYRQGLRAGVGGAIRAVLEISPDSLSRAWANALRATYGPALAGRQAPGDIGTRVLAPEIDAGRLNLAPALSPDGERVVFFSERDLFTLDLFLADANTGRVIRRLASAESDPHFDALSFMRSSGSWSPDGRRFIFVVFARGRNELAIIDVESGRIERRLAIPGVGALSDPAWSPDGGRIAVTGWRGGLTDLYVLDLATGETRQLTADRHAAFQPAWSPDGRTIAFVTDRGPRTDFRQLTYRRMGLAFADAESGDVETFVVFEGAKHVNPQYSPDGRSLFFIADPDGFSDIYRLDIGSEQVSRVTRLATGVSGLTELSAAFSVAARTGGLLFTAFEARDYIGYAMEPGRTVGDPVTAAPAQLAPGGVLPPVAAVGEGEIAAYLADPRTGLVDAVEFAVLDYRPSLRLDYIGIPMLGVIVDRFGASLGGGVAAYWSDMLGDRVLGVQAYGAGELRDLGGQAFFQNRRHRWNWAVGAGRIPYLSGQTFQGEDELGRVVFIQNRRRTFQDRILVDARYPFSTTQRFETNVGFNRISFHAEQEVITVVGRQIVDRQVERLPTPDPLNLFQAAAALVGDNSFFGFTSPIRGARYRLELEPTFGSLQFQSALVDTRRYLFQHPVTIAARAFHFGRYGRDAESPRLSPLFLGWETLIRGYSLHSFDLAECRGAAPGAGCPEFERLIGSRLGVANLELRVPLFGTAEFGLIEFPWLPTELAAFFDAGAAWTQDEPPRFRADGEDTARTPVYSTGLTSRFNLMGYLILELYYAHPFQRPERGGHFGFQIAPGW